MKIEQIEVKYNQVHQLRWLESIAREYEGAAEYMEKNRDTFTITGIGYENRGEQRVIHINPHRPIAIIPIRSALLGAADLIRKEVEKLKIEIESE